MTGRAVPSRGRWLGWTPDTAPPWPLGPRCGRVLILDGRYERGGIPGDPGNPPRCGRPAGHPGPCRSENAVARYLRADLDRMQSRGYEQRQLRRAAARRTA